MFYKLILLLGGIMTRRYLISQSLHKVANEVQFRAVCISALSKSDPKHVGYVITDTGDKYRVGRDPGLMVRYYRTMNPVTLAFCKPEIASEIIPKVTLKIIKVA
jgi:hypothetical protein